MLLHMAGLGTQGSKAGLAMYQVGDPMKLHGRGFVAVGLFLFSPSLSSFFFVHDLLQFTVLSFFLFLMLRMHHDMRMRMVPTQTRDDDWCTVVGCTVADVALW